MNIILATVRMGIGGAETHVYTLARELKRRGHSVAVVSSGGIYADLLEKEGLPHYTLPLDRKDPVSAASCRHGIIKLCRERHADILHAHGRLPAFICGSISHCRGVPPVITTAHGLYQKELPKGFLTHWGSRTVAVSPDISEFLQKKYGIPGNRITVIPNGVEIPAAKSKGSGRFPTILTLCRLDADSAAPVLELIRTVFRIRRANPELETRLIVAGDGNARDTVQEEADKVNALYPGTVTLTGATSDPYAAMNGADIFAGCSRAASEAMAMGLPCILLSGSEKELACGGIMTGANIRRAAGTNFIARGSNRGADLFDSLLSLITASEEERGRCADECRKYIAESCSIEGVCTQTEQLYCELLDEKKPGIWLCGYFGAGNAGDDAALEAVAGALHKRFPSAVIYAGVSGRHAVPEYLTPVSKYDCIRIRTLMKACRLFVLCGGSLLQNSTSMRSLRWYTGMLKLARSCGCRTMLLGGGCGPLEGEKAVRLADMAFSLLDTGCFRDARSLEYARRRCPGGSFSLTADPVFGIKAGPLPDGLSLPGGFFTVQVRPLAGIFGRGRAAEAERHIAAAAAALSEKTGLEALWLPMSPEDIGVCRRCAGGARVLPLMTPGQIISLAGKSRFAVSERLHGAILAAMAGVPCICIDYDPKVSTFAQAANLPSLSPFRDMEAELPELVTSLSAVPPVRDFVRKMKDEAEKNIAAAEELYMLK